MSGQVSPSIFKKYYHRPDLTWQRQREAEFYLKLDGLPHFPKLLGVDEDNLYLSHCGGYVTDVLRRVRVGEVSKQLHEILGLLGECGIRHRDITKNNLLWKDGVLYLVDFGWSIWSTETDTPVPVPQVMRWWICDMSDREQVEYTLSRLESKQ